MIRLLSTRKWSCGIVWRLETIGRVNVALRSKCTWSWDAECQKSTVDDLSRQIEFRGGDGCIFPTATEQQVFGQCGTTVGDDGSDTLTITWSHNASCDDGRDTTRRDHRADAQLEVSILGFSLKAPITGAMEALRRVTRFLLGTSDASVNLTLKVDDLFAGGVDGLLRQ